MCASKRCLAALVLSLFLVVVGMPQVYAVAQEAQDAMESSNIESQAEEQNTPLVSSSEEPEEVLVAEQEATTDVPSDATDATSASEKSSIEVVSEATAEQELEKIEVAEDTAELEVEAARPTVSYRTHVQNVGWQKWFSNGAMAGTSGRSLRLEAVELKLSKLAYSGGITYRTHVQNIGWQDWKSDGATAGTSGRSLRLEAIQIELYGEAAEHYDVYYRVHAQNYGWMGWAKNGERAGTATMSKRLEALQVVVVPNTEAGPSTTYNNVSQNVAQAYLTRCITYQTHVQNIGWQDWRSDGAKAGTSGRSLRLEAINIKLPDPLYAGGITYRTHVQNIGWQGWKSDGATAGTSGRSLRLEAIQIQLNGEMAEHYDVYYRVHTQNVGWMGWAKNGAEAGTAGYSLRLEAIQIVLVSKDSAAPSTSFQGETQATSSAFRSKSATASPTTGDATSSGPQSAGALQVKGNQLVDAHGKAIQLQGVSTHGLAWFPGYVNNDCFKQIRNQWNANVVRLAMYTEEYGGYCSGGDKDELTELVKNGVRYAANNDLYAIVDWHILSDGNPNTHVNEAKAFFQEISSTFKGNNNVIYEICNEPNGGTTWDQIVSYAKKVIPVIRQNDPDAIIIVGTPTWSQEIDKAAAQPLPYDNVMYALHFYAATHKDDLRNRMVEVVKNGLPVFVSEFGICDASGNGSIDEDSANSWMTTMNSLGVSWCMWSLCNKNEAASALKSSCNATSGFSSDDLSTSGTWLLKALNGTLPKGTDSAQMPTAGTPSVSSNRSSYTFQSGNFTCEITLTNTWYVDGGKQKYQYKLSITNNGPTRTSWMVNVPFTKSIFLNDCWNAVCMASGRRLMVHNSSYNGSIETGATCSNVGFQVTSQRGLEIDC